MKFRESEIVEFKKSISGLVSSIKTICAFLNNKGGEVYFGIDRRGKVIGQIPTDANLNLEMMDKEDLNKPGFEETGDSFRIIFNRHVTPRLPPKFY
jgi:hypothetical protein